MDARLDRDTESAPWTAEGKGSEPRSMGFFVRPQQIFYLMLNCSFYSVLKSDSQQLLSHQQQYKKSDVHNVLFTNISAEIFEIKSLLQMLEIRTDTWLTVSLAKIYVHWTLSSYQQIYFAFYQEFKIFTIGHLTARTENRKSFVAWKQF